MNIRVLLTVAVATLFAVATSTADNDKQTKKSKKAELSCCSQKSEAKADDASTKKETGKSCCDEMEKAEMKDGKEGEKKACCSEHEKKAEIKKTKSQEKKGTR